MKTTDSIINDTVQKHSRNMRRLRKVSPMLHKAYTKHKHAAALKEFNRVFGVK